MRRTILILGALAIISCKTQSDKIVNEEVVVADTITNPTTSDFSPKDNSTSGSLLTIEDTIRYHFGIADSLELISASYYGEADHDEHVRVFVDHNTNSIFHKEILSDYGCDCLNEKLYNSVYEESLHKFKDSINVDHKQFKDLFGHWIPVKKKGTKFYLERIVCEFNRHGFTLSDSALIEYDMDGPYPRLLLNIEEVDNEIVIKTSNNVYKLKKLNVDDEIYWYDEQYLIHSRNLNSYPIIVTDCHEVGASTR
jgi:hypothetical protein